MGNLNLLRLKSDHFCCEIDRRGLTNAAFIFAVSSYEPFADPSCVLIFAEYFAARLVTSRYCAIEVGGGMMLKLTSFMFLFLTDFATTLLYLLCAYLLLL